MNAHWPLAITLLMSLESPSLHAGDTVRPEPSGQEQQVTHGPGGRILTHTGIWSPDSRWLVYDVRSDPAGDVFDGSRIEMVNVETGEVRVLYESRRGAHCGVATFHTQGDRVVFILGPEDPTPDWSYSVSHRQGVIVELAHPGRARLLDARDLSLPFTPGALRGGTHVHVWEPAGDWLSFTYNDALRDPDVRDVGVCLPRAVRVHKDHPRNHDGEYFSVVVTRTTPQPRPGSDEIGRACEEAWIGTNGYIRSDGARQHRALAFQGQVATPQGGKVTEVFVVDLPEDLTQDGDGPLAGDASRRPSPPRGVRQRRLTFTAGRKFPGVQGPRHWLRSSPDGTRVAFLMKDDAGVVQLWTISPNGGAPMQLTRHAWSVGSAFSWSADGRRLAHVLDNSVAVTDAATGVSTRLTPRCDDALAPRPEACVFSPDQRRIAYVRRVAEGGRTSNQIFVLTLGEQ
jgi:hypothetical protein